MRDFLSQENFLVCVGLILLRLFLLALKLFLDRQ